MKLVISILVFFVFAADCAIASSDPKQGKGLPQCKPRSSDLTQPQILAIAKANLILSKAALEKTRFSVRKQDSACGWSVVALPPSDKPGSAVHLYVSNDGKKIDLLPSW